MIFPDFPPTIQCNSMPFLLPSFLCVGRRFFSAEILISSKISLFSIRRAFGYSFFLAWRVFVYIVHFAEFWMVNQEESLRGKQGARLG
jgi:hypothetical protein